jgi:hypothetical protein
MADVPSGPIPPPPPPPEGTPPGPGSLRPRTLGEILSAAFEIYKNNAQGLIVIVAIIVVPLSLISALILHYAVSNTTTTTKSVNGVTVTLNSTSVGTAIAGGVIAAAIAIIIGALLQAAIIRAGAQATIGDPVDVEDSYRYGFHRIGSVVLVGLLVGLAVAFGFILLVIPGILALVYFSVSIPSLVVENRRGTKAMSRSANLVSGHFWHAFGVIIVAYIIVAVVSGILSAIGGNSWFIRWIFNAIAQIITTPFSALVSVLLYLDLRARKEALTTQVLRSELSAGM